MPPERKTNQSVPSGASVVSAVLKAAEPRPTRADSVGIKIQYATRFADQMAEAIARDLSPRLSGIAATTKRTAVAVGGKKQLDVNFSTPHLGLALGISLKSVHIRDVGGSGRYTHNRKRNEEELRIEATGYHKRQPYAVMVGVLFLPFDSCGDGKKDNPSSFGSWIRHLRPHAGRKKPIDEPDKFEKIFVALYEPDGSELSFFDVEWNPPKNGRPKLLRTYAEFLDDVYLSYLERNDTDFTWAEGEQEPLEIEAALFDEEGQDEDNTPS